MSILRKRAWRHVRTDMIYGVGDIVHLQDTEELFVIRKFVEPRAKNDAGHVHAVEHAASQTGITKTFPPEDFGLSFTR